MNGERVDTIEKDEKGHTYYMQNLELPAFDLENIETIVTKEQFESISYKVERKN